MYGFVPEYKRIIAQGNLDRPALIYLDIRNFRSVNPKYGFLEGNKMLRFIVQAIDMHLSKGLPIVRLGGDRFVFLLEGFSFNEAEIAFYKFADEVNKFAEREGIKHHFSFSAGIYYLRDADFESLDHNRPLDYASIAHRNAREERSSRLILFSEEDLIRDNRRITIEQTIDEALVQGQIEVWYQPQVDYLYGDIIGAEALARWNHPELGWISPGEFIPVLENCGKIHELDLFIWEEACRSAGRWRNASDGKPVPISVNVSRAEMFEEGLLEHFIALQQKYDLPKGSLRLEVTESAFVEEAERLYRIIENMRKHDMLVEMDDFGSGLSSLSMLKDVPVDVVKLDMGFMRTAINEERGGVVLSSAIRMLQGLDTPIIAEGVETLEQAEMLKNMGCHLMQGFHFSHPMPLREFESFIQSNAVTYEDGIKARSVSHLEELTSFDASSSYLFNEAIGGTVFFFAGEGSSESILVNDRFYQDCGLSREVFGNAKVNPIMEVDEKTREGLWRAAAEAREKGAAFCRAVVRLTGYWFEGVIRYIGNSKRGDIYSLNIVRSGMGELPDGQVRGIIDSEKWNMALLDKIIPHGFIKCSYHNEDLRIDYMSPELIEHSGYTLAELSQRFHNSFRELVVERDRSRVLVTIADSARANKSFECSFMAYNSRVGEIGLTLFGRVDQDFQGQKWLYALVLTRGVLDKNGDGEHAHKSRIIAFDYYLADDLLYVYVPHQDGTQQEIVRKGWLAGIDQMPDNVSKASAAKILATVKDLRAHPISGFSDIKCNLTGGPELRWFHINYSCESDDEGNTTVIHGFAQDADDQMGSTKWWRRQAEIDQLTGLLNRNAVEQEINLAMRTEGLGMMFMIDLDGFKRINDEMSHLVGDELLRRVASALSDHFREGDTLGRYGGDEFVAFMAAPSLEAAHALAERRAQDILGAISAIDVGDGTYAGCSVGVAISQDKEATFYDLLEVADAAMYQSKNAGKGRYSISEMA